MGDKMNFLTGTNSKLQSSAMFLVRLAAGVILFAAGAGKVFGWFGGFGLDATVKMFVEHMRIPAILAYMCCFAELIGGFFLIIGFLTRPAAFVLTINMIVATAVTLPNGFMSPSGGAAFPLTVLLCCAAVLIAGPMCLSLDALLSKKCSENSCH